MPVNHFRILARIANLDALLLALAHAQKWSGNLAVIRHSAEMLARRCLKRIRRNIQRHIWYRRGANR